jgi:hypothetical protein
MPAQNIIESLNILGDEVLKSKVQRMKNLLKISTEDEALYREIMLSLGYPKNKVQFLDLALLTPYKELKRLRTRELIEKALLYRAGFTEDSEGLPKDFDVSLRIDKSVWVLKHIRPANFPDKRIMGISNLLSESAETGIYSYFKERIQENNFENVDKNTAKKIVQKIVDFEGIGKARKEEMFFNIILPFMLADSSCGEYHPFLYKLFENHPPLADNSLIKKFFALVNKEGEQRINNLENVKQYFGAIKFVREYGNPKS